MHPVRRRARPLRSVSSTARRLIARPSKRGQRTEVCVVRGRDLDVAAVAVLALGGGLDRRSAVLVGYDTLPRSRAASSRSWARLRVGLARGLAADPVAPDPC